MVEGVVLLDGKPIEGATVFFSPASAAGDAACGLPAAGMTRADGGFTLNAGGGAKPGAGTKAGDYVVTVVKQEVDGVPQSYDPATPPDFSKIKVRELLPTVYKLRETSTLRATVRWSSCTHSTNAKGPVPTGFNPPSGDASIEGAAM